MPRGQEQRFSYSQYPVCTWLMAWHIVGAQLMWAACTLLATVRTFEDLTGYYSIDNWGRSRLRPLVQRESVAQCASQSMMCSNEPQREQAKCRFLIRLVLCGAQDYEFLIISPVCTLNSDCVRETAQERRTLDPAQFLSGDFEEETSPPWASVPSSVKWG